MWRSRQQPSLHVPGVRPKANAGPQGGVRCDSPNAVWRDSSTTEPPRRGQVRAGEGSDAHRKASRRLSLSILGVIGRRRGAKSPHGLKKQKIGAQKLAWRQRLVVWLGFAHTITERSHQPAI